MASPTIRPATGTLGILTPGLGAVATTFMAGVESIRRGHSKPIGSLTQMATIRLGKRTDNRSPLIKEFVPLARARQPRVRRVGSDSRRRVHGREEGRRARGPRPRAGRRVPQGHQADARRVRQQVRHANPRRERQEGEIEARPRRAAAAGHARLQVEAQVRSPGDRLVRVDRDLHQARPAARDDPAVRARDGAERRRDLAGDALRVGRDHGRAFRTATARRTWRWTRRRCNSSPTTRASRFPARISRPARRG